MAVTSDELSPIIQVLSDKGYGILAAKLVAVRDELDRHRAQNVGQNEGDAGAAKQRALELHDAAYQAGKLSCYEGFISDDDRRAIEDRQDAARAQFGLRPFLRG